MHPTINLFWGILNGLNHWNTAVWEEIIVIMTWLLYVWKALPVFAELYHIIFVRDSHSEHFNFNFVSPNHHYFTTCSTLGHYETNKSWPSNDMFIPGLELQCSGSFDNALDYCDHNRDGEESKHFVIVYSTKSYKVRKLQIFMSYDIINLIMIYKTCSLQQS